MSNHILIIEDDQVLAASLEDIFEHDAYNVTVCHSGHDGLATALAEQPDLIILDIKMPDMNGYQVYEKLRSDSWGATAKVIVLTASESLDNIAKNIDLPREDILFKPQISVTELQQTIAQKLSN